MRKKSKRTKRRKTVTEKGAKALAAGAAIAAGTQAYAAPVRFDNPAHGEPGHFHWPPPSSTGGDGEWLDITLDAANQSGSGGSKFLQYLEGYYGYYSPLGSWLEGNPGLAELETVISAGYGSSRYLPPLGAGHVIPSGRPFHHYGYIAGIYADSTPYQYGYLPPGHSYLGVRVNLGGLWHYGWIAVDFNGYFSLEAFAWGYETEPGVPIAAGIPEPDTLAMLALGFVGVAAARRRSRQAARR
jgi:hypothetical protein